MGEMERRLVDAMNEKDRKDTEQFMRLREELSTRVGVEKMEISIIGGSIVIGFALTEILPILM